jgi:tetratricopeptide (TPR) repeat protein
MISDRQQVGNQLIDPKHYSPGFTATIALLLGMSCNVTALAHDTIDEKLRQTSSDLSQDPLDQAVWLERAWLYLKHGDLDLARADIETAEMLAGDHEAAYLTGLYHLAKNDYPAAIEGFSQYLRRYPYHIPSLHKRARAHGKLQLTKQAIDDYQALIDISQKPSPDYYLELAAIEATLEADGLERALKSLNRGIDRLGPLVSLQNVAIGYDIARADYRSALRRHQSIQPWVGNTARWIRIQTQLADKLQAQNSGKDLSSLGDGS